DALAQCVDETTGLVSIIWGNNEVGTLQAMAPLAALAHGRGGLVHTDAVQVVGQMPLDVKALGVDLMSLSGHKFYAPQGVGALYVRAGTGLEAVQTGGGQESERRAGTHNLAGIVGMAAALTIAHDEMDDHRTRIMMLRDHLIAGMLTALPGVVLTGHPTERLPNHASFIVEGVEANLLLMHLDMKGIMASSGSACKTGSPEPSDVLLAMGFTAREALCGLRLTLGRETTEQAIETTIAALVEVVEKLRRLQAGMKGS
ncbi:MAG: cysteine desulfurase family protein, partial [Chloroflexota bacterium]|nr:cysteine desulfurase family protein [Chloroflexota bacterium]